MGKYDDIIDLPHHVSGRHPQMSMTDRAAQFSAFKALTGLEDDLAETARVTDRRIELSEEELAGLNEKFTRICQKEHPTVKVTYFVPDLLKDGGRYETITGTVKRVDPYEKLLVFTDRTAVKITDITEIEETGEALSGDGQQTGGGFYEN